MPDFSNLFRSARLVYRSASDSQEDTDFIASITANADALANSHTNLLRPIRPSDVTKWKEYMTKEALLGVLICLPAEGPDAAKTAAGTPIGSIMLDSIEPRHMHHRNTSIGVDITREYQGKGYGTEAINWALDWAFNFAGMHRMGIECFSWNEGAARLYERLGFTLDGKDRHVYWFNGAWHDNINFSMLEDEWRELRRKGQGVNPLAVEN